MKELTLKIIINKPASDVYAFYVNPHNTPLWLNSVVQEITSDWPIKVGTHYKNQNKKNIWGEYIVVALKENELFELVSNDGNYHVRYTHKTVNGHASELTYYEWVDKGDLEEPFTLDILQKLKEIVEI